MRIARRIPASDLKTGMVTPDWVVMDKPQLIRNEWVVSMRHRVDGGLSAIAYQKDARITIIEEVVG